MKKHNKWNKFYWWYLPWHTKLGENSPETSWLMAKSGSLNLWYQAWLLQTGIETTS